MPLLAHFFPGKGDVCTIVILVFVVAGLSLLDCHVASSHMYGAADVFSLEILGRHCAKVKKRLILFFLWPLDVRILHAIRALWDGPGKLSWCYRSATPSTTKATPGHFSRCQMEIGDPFFLREKRLDFGSHVGTKPTKKRPQLCAQLTSS